jgi:hypothetical protein
LLLHPDIRPQSGAATRLRTPLTCALSALSIFGKWLDHCSCNFGLDEAQGLQQAMVRWAYRWNQNRNVKSPLPGACRRAVRSLASAPWKRRCAEGQGVRDGVYP